MVHGKEISNIPDSEKFENMLGVLPQNPQSLFVKKTVEPDLYEMLKGKKLSKDEQHKRVRRVSNLCGLTYSYCRNFNINSNTPDYFYRSILFKRQKILFYISSHYFRNYDSFCHDF